MNNRNDELNEKVKEIIVIDNNYRKEWGKKYPNGQHTDFSSDTDISEALSDEGKPLVIDALKRLNTDGLAYVMAVMLHGRSHLDNGPEYSGNFDDELSHAKRTVNDMSIGYMTSKLQLGEYLSEGLKHL